MRCGRTGHRHSSRGCPVARNQRSFPMRHEERLHCARVRCRHAPAHPAPVLPGRADGGDLGWKPLQLSLRGICQSAGLAGGIQNRSIFYAWKHHVGAACRLAACPVEKNAGVADCMRPHAHISMLPGEPSMMRTSAEGRATSRSKWPESGPMLGSTACGIVVQRPHAKRRDSNTPQP